MPSPGVLPSTTITYQPSADAKKAVLAESQGIGMSVSTHAPPVGASQPVDARCTLILADELPRKHALAAMAIVTDSFFRRKILYE